MAEIDKNSNVSLSKVKRIPSLSSFPSPSIVSSGPDTPTTDFHGGGGGGTKSDSDSNLKSALKTLSTRDSDLQYPHSTISQDNKPSFDFNQSRLFSLITSRDTFPSPSETTIKLKVRYVAKDLWLNITFNNSLTATQVRDICLKKAYAFDEDPIEHDLVVLSPTLSDDTTEITQYNSISQTQSLIPKVKDASWYHSYALFWNSAGHWLDGFRKLSSYMLRENDILELQERDQFIFIPPALYHEHYAEGWLYKLCGGLNPKWKRRWFILKGSSVWQFRRRRDPTPLGQANLESNFQISETSVEHNGSQVSCLILKFGTKSWWLRGICTEDLHHWRRIFITLHNEIEHPSRNCFTSPNNNRYSVTPSNLDVPDDHDCTSLQEVPRSGIRVKAGFMFRRIPIAQGFRERYFVLKGRELCCYRSDRFDKANAMTSILLHTVEACAYEEGGRFYIKINDCQSNGKSIKNDWEKKSIRKSVLSSTRSLSIQAASWIRKKRGGQQDTEIFYVTTREEWEAWREALESIANLTIPLGAPPPPKAARTIVSKISGSGSSWLKLSPRKPQFSGLRRTQTNKSPPSARASQFRPSRFSAFIKTPSLMPSSKGISKNDLPPSLSFESSDSTYFVQANRTSVSLTVRPISEYPPEREP